MTEWAAGIYPGMPPEVYHADPVPGGSLSVTRSKWLLPPYCPAHYRWAIDHPDEFVPSQAMTLGSAAHTYALGEGAEIVRVPFDTYQTLAARRMRDEAIAAGNIPLKPADFAVVEAMAEQLRRHPYALDLFRGGISEASLFAQDERTGVWMRGRLDYLPKSDNARLIIPDYKTTSKVPDPETFRRSSWDFDYYRQADWYERLGQLTGHHPNPVTAFVLQGQVAPYLVSVVVFRARSMDAARFMNDRALGVYADCQAAGKWPGYTDDEVARIDLPDWALRQVEDDMEMAR